MQISNLIWRAEQKLVDVMIAVDLLDLRSRFPAGQTAVVSSDHDLWPAIKYASVGPNIVHHILTSGPMPSAYLANIGTKYQAISL